MKQALVDICLKLLEHHKDITCEYTHTAHAIRHVVKFDADNNSHMFDNNNSEIEVVLNKIEHTQYIKYKELKFMITDTECQKLHKSFFEAYYAQQNDLVLNTALVDEINELQRRFADTTSDDVTDTTTLLLQEIKRAQRQQDEQQHEHQQYIKAIERYTKLNNDSILGIAGNLFRC